jgi:transcriptional repressor NrdR
MNCPYCGSSGSRVTDSRVVENGIRRRRECRRCGLRFTTYERIQATALMVAKQDNRREEFDREKLISGIRKACAKRPIPSRTIEKMVEDIEAELQHLGQVEVPTRILGSMVMERLKNLDRVAYIRYASVYRDFQDIESFEQAVKDLREGRGTQLTLPHLEPGPGRRRRSGSDGEQRQRSRRPRPVNPEPDAEPEPDSSAYSDTESEINPGTE